MNNISKILTTLEVVRASKPSQVFKGGLPLVSFKGNLKLVIQGFSFIHAL